MERDPNTPSGAALAPWTNVGNLGKATHFEELKRRFAQLMFATFPKHAAAVRFTGTSTAEPDSKLTPAQRAQELLSMSTLLLQELQQNFSLQSKDDTGLDDQQNADAEVLAANLQLKILQAKRLSQALGGEKDAGAATGVEEAATIDAYLRFGGAGADLLSFC